MINSKKKGFTIVELVIVIAVVAILAAVLIPTFSSLVKKANTSADIQAVRQMNTQLAINEVTEGKTINDVFKALREAGMTAKDYTPLSSDTYFFWDEKENRILYTDKNGNVIYPEEYKTATKANGWYSLSGTIDETAAVIQLNKDAISKDNSYTITSAADMSKLIKFVEKYRNSYNKAGNSITITLTNDIDLMWADLSFGSLDQANIVFDGNNKEIKGLYVSDNHTHEGNTGDGQKDQYGSALFIYVNNFEVKNLTIKNSIVGSESLKQGSILAGQIRGKATYTNVTIENCTVSGLNKSGILGGFVHGQITLSNVTLKNNTVIAGEGECGILFGVATYADRANHFNVSNLEMENNEIKFAESTKTFTLNGSDVSSYISENALPKNNEFAYETGSTTGGRVGLAELCFVGTDNNYVTNHGTNGKVTIKGVEIRIAAAVNSQANLNDTTLIK